MDAKDERCVRTGMTKEGRDDSEGSRSDRKIDIENRPLATLEAYLSIIFSMSGAYVGRHSTT